MKRFIVVWIMITVFVVIGINRANAQPDSPDWWEPDHAIIRPWDGGN